MTGIEFDRELWFNESRFDGEFHMRYAKLAHLSVEGSSFANKVDFENAEFDLHLVSANATFDGYTHWFGIKVGGNSLADGSTFNEELELSSSSVGINMLLRNRTNFRGTVNLSGVRVGGVLDIGAADFERVAIYLRRCHQAGSLY